MNKLRNAIFKMVKVEIAPRGFFYAWKNTMTFSNDKESEYECRATYKILGLFKWHKEFYDFEVKNGSINFKYILNQNVKVEFIYE